MRYPDGKGRFFDARIMFVWYLFQAEAFLNRMRNYEPLFGSRIVPVLTAIGQIRALLEKLDGVEEGLEATWVFIP